MKYLPSLFTLLGLSICFPLGAETTMRQDRPMVPVEAKLTDDQRTFFQAVMDRLVEIGLVDRARRMETDLLRGKIVVTPPPQTDEEREEEQGVRGSTNPQRAGGHIMEIPQTTLNEWFKDAEEAKRLRQKGHEAAAKQREKGMRELMLDVSLTVDHEYIHMDQYFPQEDVVFENPAWRRRLDQENRLIREFSDGIRTLLEKGVSSEEDHRVLSAMTTDLREIEKVHFLTVDGELNAKLKDGKLTRSFFQEDFDARVEAQAATLALLKRADAALATSVVPKAIPVALAVTAVPSVLGMAPEAAATTLQASGFTSAPLPVQVEVKNVRSNVIFQQEPEAGAMLPKGGSVKVYFCLPARGEMATIKIPDITKLTKAEAEVKLAELKFKFEPEAGDKTPARGNKKQEVYEQSPQAGTEAKEGELVKFTYLAGIPVGRYVGLNKDDAAKAIVKAGLKPRVSEGDSLTENEAERFNIYSQSPKPGEHVWFDDEVIVEHYKLVGGGFQDGDGNEVEAARLGQAKVYSEGDNELAQYPGASGKRCAIMLTPPRSTNMMAASESWSIVKFSDAAAAKAFYQQMAGPITASQNMAGHRETLQKVDGGIVYTRNMNMRGIKSSDHICASVYREVFVIMYFMHKPEAAASTAHSAGIMQKSKELVNLRFPKP